MVAIGGIVSADKFEASFFLESDVTSVKRAWHRSLIWFAEPGRPLIKTLSHHPYYGVIRQVLSSGYN